MIPLHEISKRQIHIDSKIRGYQSPAGGSNEELLINEWVEFLLGGMNKFWK